MKNTSEQFPNFKDKLMVRAAAVFCLGAAALGIATSHPKASAEKTKIEAVAQPRGKDSPTVLSEAKIKIIDNLDLPEDKKAFIKWTMPIILYKYHEGAPIQPAVVEAQTIIETGYGLHAPGNAYFGVKATKGNKSKVYDTQEKVNGEYGPTRDAFSQYGSFEESLDGYISMIERLPWYKDARENTTNEGYLYGLQHDSKYFNKYGDPLIYASAGQDYTDLINAVIRDCHLVELTS